MSAAAALVELVRDALRDPSIRDEIKAIVSGDEGSPTVIAPETSHSSTRTRWASCWA